MDLDGYYKAHRKQWDCKELYRKPNAFIVWHWIISQAQIRERGGMERGDAWASVRHIAENTGVPRSTVHDILKRFEKAKMIVRRSAENPDTLTVTKYALYQDLNACDETGSRTPSGHHPDKEEERKNVRTRKEPPIVPLELDSERFRELWVDYVAEHRKTARAQKMALKKLERWGHDAACVALENSLANGWKGVFEPKDGDWNAKPNDANRRLQEKIDALGANVQPLPRRIDGIVPGDLDSPDSGHSNGQTGRGDRQVDLF